MRAAQHGGAGGSPVRSGLDAPPAGGLNPARSVHPRPSETGVEITTPRPQTGLHTTTFTVWGYNVQDVAAHLMELLGFPTSDAWDWSEVWNIPPYGTRHYKHQARGPKGIWLQWDGRAREEAGVNVSMTGEAMDCVEFADFWALLAEYSQAGRVKVSRIDAYVDYCPFKPKKLYAAASAGDIRSRMKRDNPDWINFTRNAAYETLGLGSRDSESYLRCYDKRGFTRLELELKGDKAQAFALAFVGSPERFPELVVGAIRSHVDFVAASADNNITRAPLLGWWSAFVGNVSVVRLALEKAHKSLEETVEEAVKQVRSRVAYIVRVAQHWGQDAGVVLREVVENGFSNFSPACAAKLAYHGVPR